MPLGPRADPLLAHFTAFSTLALYLSGTQVVGLVACYQEWMLEVTFVCLSRFSSGVPLIPSAVL